ncbi:MAG: anaerobic sulfatase maturase [Proteobacteria bacterium]|nr:anaerobic sulfatase maturase [Pseudomonadota bacterium]
MGTKLSEFQIFAKPIGARCNLDCGYCYYLEKEDLYPGKTSFQMGDDLLEDYISQVIHGTREPEIRFSWHGGEPTLPGVEFFKKIVLLQKKHAPEGRAVLNNIQTNGTLLDEKWCDFLARENFTVGLSMDGPARFHDGFRVSKGGMPTHEKVLRAWEFLSARGVTTDILCVVHAQNVFHPREVYGFFKEIQARYIGFLPIVKKDPASPSGVSSYSVPSKAFGEFLCTVFDLWKREDIGKVLIQIFEEVTRTALGQEHSLCLFRKTCGNCPVVEHNGDFYACDHFVTPEFRPGNIQQTPLNELLDSRTQQAFGQSKRNTLPGKCRKCSVLSFCNGGCPKDRFLETGDGKNKLNYLCDGYKLFFNHCAPFVQALSREYRSKTLGQKYLSMAGTHGQKPRRNDLCPCGSGKKYKTCCLNTNGIIRRQIHEL